MAIFRQAPETFSDTGVVKRGFASCCFRRLRTVAQRDDHTPKCSHPTCKCHHERPYPTQETVSTQILKQRHYKEESRGNSVHNREHNRSARRPLSSKPNRSHSCVAKSCCHRARSHRTSIERGWRRFLYAILRQFADIRDGITISFPQWGFYRTWKAHSSQAALASNQHPCSRKSRPCPSTRSDKSAKPR